MKSRYEIFVGIIVFLFLLSFSVTVHASVFNCYKSDGTVVVQNLSDTETQTCPPESNLTKPAEAPSTPLTSGTTQTQTKTPDDLANNYCCTPNGTTCVHSKPKDFLHLIQCGSAGQPCCDFVEATILVNRIINWFLSIAATIAAITFSIAGAKILMKPESAEERENAKRMFMNTVIGMFIVLTAWLIIHTAVGAIINPAINSNLPTGVFRFFQ